MAGVTYCPRCGGKMEGGFVVDFGEGSSRQAEWARGEPTISFWTGVKNKVRRKIRTFCCRDCGYLESYANVADDVT